MSVFAILKKINDSVEPPTRLEDIEQKLDSSFIISDKELSAAFKYVKALYDVFKDAKKRFERRDSVYVSSSALKFMQLKRDVVSYPYVLYDFVCDSARCCIVHFHSFYTICCIGFKPWNEDKKLIPMGRSCYGRFDTLEDSVQGFLDCVRDYLRVSFRELF